MVYRVNAVFMLSKGDLAYILITLETTLLCENNYLSNWNDHNSNSSNKWTGEEGIRIKQCVECIGN